MRITLILRNTNKENLVALKNVMDKVLSEAPQYLSKVKQEQQRIVSEKIEHLNKWYSKIIGLDEVKIYQERVTALQDQLLNTQTKRRELNKQLVEIRHKAHEVQGQIQHIDRKEKFDVYCQLINDERTILNMERSVTATFQEYDQAERDLFTAFTNAVRDSQEKQRSQMEHSKYLGLILSLVGSFLAFIYTFFWKQDLKSYMRQQIQNIPAYDESINASEANRAVTFLVAKSGLQITTHYHRQLEELQLRQHELQQRQEELNRLKQHVYIRQNLQLLGSICKYMLVGFTGYFVLRCIEAFVYTFFWKQDLKLYIRQQVDSISVNAKGIKIFEDVLNQTVSKCFIEPIDTVFKEQLQQQQQLQEQRQQQQLQHLQQYLLQQQQAQVPQQISPEEAFLSVCKYVGIGFAGYIVLRILVG